MAGNIALGDALAKKGKGGLTLAQLASYDDVITDALVDQVSTLEFARCMRSVVYGQVAHVWFLYRSITGRESARTEPDIRLHAAFRKTRFRRLYKMK